MKPNYFGGKLNKNRTTWLKLIAQNLGLDYNARGVKLTCIDYALQFAISSFRKEDVDNDTDAESQTES